MEQRELDMAVLVALHAFYDGTNIHTQNDLQTKQGLFESVHKDHEFLTPDIFEKSLERLKNMPELGSPAIINIKAMPRLNVSSPQTIVITITKHGEELAKRHRNKPNKPTRHSRFPTRGHQRTP